MLTYFSFVSFEVYAAV